MVRKFSKTGAWSGNTHRTCDRKDAKDILVRTVLNCAAGREEWENFDIWDFQPNEHVCYSLNKKGRWKQLDQLKDNILQGDKNDYNVKISIREKLKLHRSINVTCIPEKLSQKTVYFNDKDTIHEKYSPLRKKRSKCRKQQSMDEVTESHEEATPLPEVEYEIFYPSPKVSSVSHNRKLNLLESGIHKRRILEQAERKRKTIKRKLKRSSKWSGGVDDWATGSYEWDAPVEIWGEVVNDWAVTPAVFDNVRDTRHTAVCKKKTFEKRHDKDLKIIASQEVSYNRFFLNCKKLSKKRTISENLNSCYEYDLNDTDTDCISDENEQAVKGEITLSDYIDFAFQGKRTGRSKFMEKKRTGKRSNESSWKKRVLLYQNRDEDKNEVAKANPGPLQSKIQTRTENNFVSIASLDLQPAETDPCTLCEVYRDRYLEGQSLPRRFLIDMSDIICGLTETKKSKRFRKKKAGRWDWKYGHVVVPQKIDSSACLVFVHCPRAGENAFRIFLNIELKPYSLPLCYVRYNEIKTVQGIVDDVTEYLKNVPLGSLEGCDVPKNLFAPRFDVTSCLLNWPIGETYVPGQVGRAVRLAANENEWRKVSEDDVECPDMCNICYEVINISDSSTQSAMALTSCGHWFCDKCWLDHLNSRADNGSICFTCPEYGCDSPVDLVTLVSLLGLSSIRKHLTAKKRSHIQSSPRETWCPSPGCQRAVIADVPDNGEPIGVRCECSTWFCFRCQGEPHWPASCEQVKKYNLKLNTQGNDIMVLVDPSLSKTVKGKRCPGCAIFIEKNNGCPYMQCHCGADFCWSCLKIWESHDHSDMCYTKSDTEDAENLDEVFAEDVKKNLTLRSNLYSTAVNHRILRHPRRMRKLNVDICKPLQRKLQCYMARCAKKKGQIYHADNSLIQNTEGTPVDVNILSDMLHFVIELHHIIEHTAASLDNQRKGAELNPGPNYLGRLVFITSRLEAIFEDGADQNIKAVLSRYVKLRRCTLQVLESLVALQTCLRES